MKKKLIYLAGLFLITSCSEREDALIANDQSSSITNTNFQMKAPIETNRPSQNGDFIKVTDNGNVLYCIKFDGVWRHIDSPMTWNGLFVSSKTFRYEFSSIQDATFATRTYFGDPLLADNGLVQDNSTGKIYFREKNYLRWIPSMDLFNKYKFNPEAVQHVSSISGYIVNPDLK
ncbi:hypothetical protein [Chryseobacterium paludis]|uniref:hypothetical protein n=1 Tax=Chryseobacterium paludis TaxID=2956784 RepID=UPI0021BF19B1|nr:hypothetical protein [Chryseobacterium paludis]